jgi:hypothetical protein
MEELAKKTFEAYRAEVKNKTHDNKPIPDWENLTDTVRAGWLAAATFSFSAGYDCAMSNAQDLAKI